ncbi:MAG: glycoside hydrolase family 88 protein [Bacteroidota bacterium]
MKKSGSTSEEFRSLTFNGDWGASSALEMMCYRGRYNRTYSVWRDHFNDLHIGFYDHDTQTINSKVIYDGRQANAPKNLSLIVDKKGKLFVFFTIYEGGSQKLLLTKSIDAEDIQNWASAGELDLGKSPKDWDYTTIHPYIKSTEQGKLSLVWSSSAGDLYYSLSEDDGARWSSATTIYQSDVESGVKPDLQVYADKRGKVHIAMTAESANNGHAIYYFYLYNGAYYQASGAKIKSLKSGPIELEEADLVFDKPGDHTPWIWDITSNESGNSYIGYSKFTDDGDQTYSRAYWNGKAWSNQDLIGMKSAYSGTLLGAHEMISDIAGGLSFDQSSPDNVYLSIKRGQAFEIEKWSTKNRGKSWMVEQITSGSSKNNIRPVAIKNTGSLNVPQMAWIQNTTYQQFVKDPMAESGGRLEERNHKAIKFNVKSPPIDDPLSKESIIHIMRQTADWHLANPRREHRMMTPTNWHYGAFYTGLRALYDLTEEDRYKAELINIGQAHDWKPMDDIFHADRLAVIDNWSWLYRLEEDPEMIKMASWTLDIHLAQPYKRNTDVRFKNSPHKHEWWSWCDALFMAPPSFVEMWKVTDEKRYLDYMNHQWWKTSEYLYSQEDSLFFRDDRYFDQRSENGKKIFWSRGNGWVISGLARILSNLPADFEDKQKFVTQYQEMAGKLLSLQGEDGMWRVSLIDAEYLNIGESSGSAFYTYALAWGINNGLVDKKYQPAVEKAWTALCNNVNREGRLGFVQQVAGDPYPFKAEESHVYATGAFLLAGKEVYLMKSEEI